MTRVPGWVIMLAACITIGAVMGGATYLFGWLFFINGGAING